MRGERQLLHIGEYLVGRACQRLPRDIREERYREWVAELPAILHDPQVRPTLWRAVRMLSYAADTLRGAIIKAQRPVPHGMTAVLYLLLIANLASAAWEAWSIVRVPGNGLNYAQLAWSLLAVGYVVSILAHSAQRVTVMFIVSSFLVGVAISLWNVTQAPGDWANYFQAAFYFVLLLVSWRFSLWVGTDGRKASRTAR
jgi:hypothetical protein